jgi:hypothetical protein
MVTAITKHGLTAVPTRVPPPWCDLFAVKTGLRSIEPVAGAKGMAHLQLVFIDKK